MTSFGYDADGARVKRATPAGTTLTFGPLAELDPTGNWIKYYYSGDRRIARRDAAGLAFYHDDHLGSTRFMTDSTGAVVKSYTYEPFGREQSSTGSATNDRTYTGAVADADVGLLYMNARSYDPKIARFISADSIVPYPWSSQSLNRYSYTRNSPLSLVDPSGHTDLPPQYDQDGGELPPAPPPTSDERIPPSVAWDVPSLPGEIGADVGTTGGGDWIEEANDVPATSSPPLVSVDRGYMKPLKPGDPLTAAYWHIIHSKDRYKFDFDAREPETDAMAVAVSQAEWSWDSGIKLLVSPDGPTAVKLSLDSRYLKLNDDPFDGPVWGLSEQTWAIEYWGLVVLSESHRGSVPIDPAPDRGYRHNDGTIRHYLSREYGAQASPGRPWELRRPGP
jgi:RHS repeat-associated protein